MLTRSSLKKGGLLELIVKEGISMMVEKDWGWSTGQHSHHSNSQKAESEKEMELVYKTSKPIHSDSFPPGRFCCLKVSPW